MERTKAGEKEKPMVQQRTVAMALDWLMNIHLRCGGKIIVCEPTRIQVGTQMMWLVDIDTAEGTEEEMKPLYDLCQYYLALTHPDDPIFKLPNPPKVEGIDPLLPAMVSIVDGQHKLKKAILLGQKVGEEDVKKLLDFDLEKLIRACTKQVEMPGKTLLQILA